ncbi:MAG: CPBP family intramembrane glutamate endopeptidase, partial [Nitrosopumilus sp.]
MQNSNKIIQALGIPFTALLSVIFGLLLVSFPIGLFVVFESEIGGDINYEYPLTHLDIFNGTEMYQAQIDVSIGDMFVLLWTFYLVIFVIAVLGPKHGFLKSLSSIISFGKYDS